MSTSVLLTTHPAESDPSGRGRQLSASQHPIWLGQKLFPESPQYNMAFMFVLGGTLDASRFEQAFKSVLERSDALRSRVREVDGEPLLEYAELDGPVMEHLDFTDREDPVTYFEGWAQERSRRVMPLNGALWDCALITLGDDQTGWYLNQHHLITDAYSVTLVYELVVEAYEDLENVAEIPSYDPFIAHADEASRDATARAHWESIATALTEPSSFYGVRLPRGVNRTERLTVKPGRARSDAIRNWAADEAFRTFTPELSTFSILSAALGTWIHRITGKENLTFDAPASHRGLAVFRRTPGLFMSMYPFPLSTEAGDTFVSLASQAVAGAGSFLRNARPGTRASHGTGGSDVVLNFTQASFPPFADCPVQSTWIHPGHGDAMHALRLQVHDYDRTGEFTFHFDMNTEVFDSETRERACEHFLKILDALLSDPYQDIRAFPVLTQAEAQRCLIEYNRDSGEALPDATVMGLFMAQAERQPHAVALVHEAREYTYAELRDDVRAWALLLKERGIEKGSRVGLYMPRCPEMIVGVLASLQVGAAYVPLDPQHPEDRLRAIIEDACLACVLTRGVDEKLSSMDCAQLDLTQAVDPADHDLPGPVLEDVAYLIYTSGSSGRPKGVEIRHEGLSDYITWAARSYLKEEKQTFAFFTSLSFDLTVTSLFLPLVSGGRLIIYEQSDELVDSTITRVLADSRLDFIKLTPSHLSLLRHLDTTNCRIQTMIVGGEELRRETALDISKRLPGVRLFNEYGPTEAVVGCMIHLFDPETDTGAGVPIGRPADHVNLYLLNEKMQPVPEGCIGELYIARHGLAEGYHQRDALTEERFRDNPFNPGTKFYRTGDLGRFVSAGVMEYGGRCDEQIKVRGTRIEPAEVEAAILEFPGMQEAVVMLADVSRISAETRDVKCARCGVGAGVPGVALCADGICETCVAYDLYKDRAQSYFRNMDDLQAVFDESKTDGPSDRKYDCMMLLSGGKDSTYALYRLAGMGLRIYVFSMDNGFISDGAKANIRRAVEDLGLELEFGTTHAMNAIFRDSLDRYSNVCQGCFKTIYTLAVNRARELGIPTIVTGLSRGQLFETRLHETLFRGDRFDSDDIDQAVLEARKHYHRVPDEVSRSLDVEVFRGDTVFEQIRFVDFYRYCDVSMSEMFEFLEAHAPWTRPSDTGRSTNCLINDVGIYVHKHERGFHNYAQPYSWDVRMGHKTRDEAVDELDDEINKERVEEILHEIGYTPAERQSGNAQVLTAYIVSDRPISPGELRTHLTERVPAAMVPARVVPLDALPLTLNGKVDRRRLPLPDGSAREGGTVPSTDDGERLAEIWSDVLNVAEVHLEDDFFDLGGSSLTAMAMMFRVCEAFTVDLPLQLPFHEPVFASMLKQIDSGGIVMDAVASAPEKADGEPSRLSPYQQGLWMEYQLSPEDPAHHMVKAYQVDSALDIARLERAWKDVVARQPMLSVGISREGVPEMSELAAVFTRYAYAGDPLSCLEERARQPFDMETGPLCRLEYYEGERPLLLVMIHHVISDAQGMQILLSSLASAYNGDSADMHAYELHEILHAADVTEAKLLKSLHYWTSQLAGLPLPDPWPVAGLAPPEVGGGLLYRQVPASLSKRIRNLASSRGVTRNMVCLGAFLILLQRHTGGQDLAVGMPVSVRDSKASSGMIGYFLNTLALRFNVERSLSFGDLLNHVKKRVLEAMEHAACPLDRLLREMNAGRQELFRHAFVYVEEPETTFSLKGVELNEMTVASGGSVFDTTFFAIQRGEEMQFALEYDQALYGQEEAAMLLEQLEGILESATEAPSACPSLPCPSEEPVTTSMSVPDSLLPGIRKIATSRPDAVAIRSHGVTWTYQQLLEKTDEVRHALRQVGVSKGDAVVVLTGNCPELLPAMLGVMENGSIYVPVDPAHPSGRIAQVFQDCQADTALVCDPTIRLPTGVRGIVLHTLSDRCAEPFPTLEGEDIAYIIYTSGSTGRPKGVPIRHKSLAGSTLAREKVYGDTPASFLLLSSSAFDSSLAGIFWTLAGGGTLAIPDREHVRDPARLVGCLRDWKITHLLAIPSFYGELLEALRGPVKSLQKVIVAGESLTERVARRHAEKMAGVPLYNEYGPSELTVWATVASIAPHERAPFPIGKAIPGCILKVVDAEGVALADGIPGELWLSGPGLSAGYLRQPDRTAESFRTDALDGKRWYRTGDRVIRRGDGNLVFLGRQDEQVKVRGYRIECGEVEHVLTSHPDITEAVVFQDGTVDLAAMLATLPASRAEDVLRGIEQTRRAAHRITRNKFTIELMLNTGDVIRPPREEQRQWLLHQATSEWADDLEHLDQLSRSMVAGQSSRLRDAYPDIAEAALSDQEIMEDWQTPLMKAMADLVTQSHGDVLEIGFGRGVSADYIQAGGVKSHTIIEPNPHSIRAHFHPWRASMPDRDIRLIEGLWQDCNPMPEQFDAIFFHAFPLNEQEYIDTVLSDITFAAHAMPALSAWLRPGGVFTYLTTEMDSLSRRHQRLLFRHFSKISMKVIPLEVPEDTHDTWWSDSMVVVEAVK